MCVCALLRFGYVLESLSKYFLGRICDDIRRIGAGFVEREKWDGVIVQLFLWIAWAVSSF